MSEIKIRLSSGEIIGILIVVVGLLLLLYSFMIANDFLRIEFKVDEAFGIRFIFLICMLGIGGYLTGKGAMLTESLRIVSMIVALVGLFMLCFSFIIANIIAGGEFIFREETLMFPIKIFFFLYIIGISGYLTGEGVTLANYPKITGSILTLIGAIMLLFSFLMANKFVSGEFSMATETLIFMIRIVFFICMIGIGGYLTGRGALEIMKK